MPMSTVIRSLLVITALFAAWLIASVSAALFLNSPTRVWCSVLVSAGIAYGVAWKVLGARMPSKAATEAFVLGHLILGVIVFAVGWLAAWTSQFGQLAH
jgi:hypothetical protein